MTMLKEIAIIRLSFLLFAFLMTAAANSNKFLIKIEERDIKPYRIDLEIQDIRSPHECVTACIVTTNCVGGRQLLDKWICQLTIHSSGIMGYQSNKTATEKDYVFGTVCGSSYGYNTRIRALIHGHNDRIIRKSGISLEECQKHCTPLAWCLSADINPKGCYLAGVNSGYVLVKPHTNSNQQHASKKCS